MGYDGTLKFDTSIDSSGFQKGIDSISSIASSSLKATTAIIGGVSTAVAGIGTAAVNVGMEFEAQMSRVQGISGATGQAFADLEQMAIDLGASTAFSATEAAQGMENLASAGFDTVEIMDAMPGMLDLAASSGEDLATSAEIAASTLRGFGLEAGEAAHVADVLAKNAADTNAAVYDTGEAMKYVAPVAHAMGLSLEEVTASIGLMANAGIQGGQAGTTLRAALTRLTNPTKTMKETMDELGLSFFDSEGKMLSLTEMTAMLKEKTADLTDEEKNAAFATIFGQEALSGMLALIDAGPEQLAELTKGLENCDGAAATMAATMQDNLKGAVEGFMGSIETLGIMIYQSLEEPLKDVVQEAQLMADQLLEAYNENGLKGMVEGVGSVMAQIVQKVAEAAPEFINTAVDLIEGFCENLRNAPGIGEASAELITALVTALMSCTEQLWTTAITLAGKLAEGLAEGAPQMIDSAIECISGIVDTAIEWAPNILSAGIEIAASLIEGIGSKIPDMFSTGIEMLTQLTSGIKQNLPDMIAVGMEALMNFSGTLRENVGDLVDAGLELIMALAQSLIDNIPVFIETVPTIITNLAGIINDNAPKLLSAGLELIIKLAAGLVQAIPTLVANIPEIIEAIVSAFLAFNWLDLGKNIITFIKNGIQTLTTAIPETLANICTTARDTILNGGWADVGSNVINFIVNGVKSLLTLIPETLKGIANDAITMFTTMDWADLGVNLIGGIVAGISGSLNGVWEAIGNLCSGILDAFKSFFGIHSPSTVMQEQADFLVQGVINGLQSMPELCAEIFSNVLNNVIQWGSDLLGNAGQAASDTLTNVTDFFSQMPGNVNNHLTTALTNVKTWGTETLNNAKTAANNVLTNVTNYFSQMPGKVQSHLTTTLNNAKNWGTNTLNSMKTSANNMLKNVESYFKQMPGKVKTQLDKVISNAKSWGSNAVSNFKTIGKNVIQGLINGITGMVSKLYTSIKNALSGLVDKAKKALGINSPSKVFADEVGKWIPGGIEAGIDAGMPSVNADMENQAGSLVDNAVNALAAMPEQFSAILSSIGDKMAVWGTDVQDTATDASEGVMGSLSSTFAQMPNVVQEHLDATLEHIKNWSSQTKTDCVSGISTLPEEMGVILDEAGNKAKNLGQTMTTEFKKMGDDSIQSMIDGIRNKTSELYDCIKDVLSELVEQAKDSLEISSPSAVFADQIGQWIPSGIEEGIRLEMPGLLDSLKAQSDSLVQTVIDGLADMPERSTEVLRQTLDKAIEWGSDILAKGKELARDLEKGFNGEMPRLSNDLKSQVDALIQKMQAAVKAEAEKIEIKSNVTETYKVQQENGKAFKEQKTEVTIDGTIHTHVEIDGEEVAEATTPYMDRNLGRRFTQAARGV